MSKRESLEIRENIDGGWGQYVNIDLKEDRLSTLDNLTTSLLELEEEEKDDKYCSEFCRIS